MNKELLLEIEEVLSENTFDEEGKCTGCGKDKCHPRCSVKIALGKVRLELAKLETEGTKCQI